MKRSRDFLGLEYSRVPFHGVCAICHEPARMTITDRAIGFPIGKCCVEETINAAKALLRAGLDMPDASLIARNP